MTQVQQYTIAISDFCIEHKAYLQKFFEENDVNFTIVFDRDNNKFLLSPDHQRIKFIDKIHKQNAQSILIHYGFKVTLPESTNEYYEYLNVSHDVVKYPNLLLKDVYAINVCEEVIVAYLNNNKFRRRNYSNTRYGVEALSHKLLGCDRHFYIKVQRRA